MADGSFIIGVCGGSGSGKTTLAKALLADARFHPASSLSLDAYYRSPEQITDEIRGNYDHPEALDTALFAQHISQLCSGHSIEAPRYCFATHRRQNETDCVISERIVVVDGVLLLALQKVLPMIDLKVYVDTPADVRLARRLRRDVSERGRDLNSVLNQYEQTVRPMHKRFVEPSRAKADLIFDGKKSFANAINELVKYI